MSPQDWDPDADNYGHFLIPPVLQAQIELLTTVYVLLPMKKAVLKELESLVKNNRTQSWFTIYLCMFIIMHSCALLTKAERVRAQREPRMPNSPSEVKSNRIAGSGNSCLHYFTISRHSTMTPSS